MEHIVLDVGFQIMRDYVLIAEEIKMLMKESLYHLLKVAEKMVNRASIPDAYLMLRTHAKDAEGLQEDSNAMIE